MFAREVSHFRGEQERRHPTSQARKREGIRHQRAYKILIPFFGRTRLSCMWGREGAGRLSKLAFPSSTPGTGKTSSGGDGGPQSRATMPGEREWRPLISNHHIAAPVIECIHGYEFVYVYTFVFIIITFGFMRESTQPYTYIHTYTPTYTIYVYTYTCIYDIHKYVPFQKRSFRWAAPLPVLLLALTWSGNVTLSRHEISRKWFAFRSKPSWMLSFFISDYAQTRQQGIWYLFVPLPRVECIG